MAKYYQKNKHPRSYNMSQEQDTKTKQRYLDFLTESNKVFTLVYLRF